MQTLIHLALAALPVAVPAGPPTAPKSFSCKYEAAGGDIIGEASIELRDGKIVKVDFSDMFAGNPGQLGYSCFIEEARGDGKWRDVEGGIEVELPNAADFGDGSSMLVRTTAKGYTLDLTQAKSSGICGAGAALPDSLTIVKASKKCLVRNPTGN